MMLVQRQTLQLAEGVRSYYLDLALFYTNKPIVKT